KSEGHAVLWVDTTDLDFVQNEADYTYVFNQINELIGGHNHESI
ncbi:transglutaminase-like cysteine peptidase, partial [Staphylococcus pseudintermedius]|nr:transglutaminase-like cysteine peptidase [Staphylococcus pseudintermedius]